MSEKTFHLEIITPKQVVFSGEVIDFVAPGAGGIFEILRNHAAFISSIHIGVVRLRHADGENEYLATSGGFVEVQNNKVKFLAETCEKASEIDLKRAQQAEERARHRLEQRANYNPERAIQALKRAQNRMKVAAKMNRM